MLDRADLENAKVNVQRELTGAEVMVELNGVLLEHINKQINKLPPITEAELNKAPNGVG